MGRLQSIVVPRFSIEFNYSKEWSMVFKGTTIFFSGKLTLATSLPDDQEISFVTPTTGSDARGNPVPLKGTIAITVSDPALLSVVQPDPLTPANALSGVIRPIGPLGKGQVVFTDTGDSASPLTVVVEIEVLAGAAVTLNPPVLGNLRPINSVPTPAV